MDPNFKALYAEIGETSLIRAAIEKARNVVHSFLLLARYFDLDTSPNRSYSEIRDIRELSSGKSSSAFAESWDWTRICN